jgi:hypothetical protein
MGQAAERVAVPPERAQHHGRGGVAGLGHGLLQARLRPVVQDILPLHGHAQRLQIERGQLVDQVIPADSGHHRLQRGVPRRRALGDDQGACPGQLRDLAEELRLGDVHHRDEDEAQGRYPVLERDDRGPDPDHARLDVLQSATSFGIFARLGR